MSTESVYDGQFERLKWDITGHFWWDPKTSDDFSPGDILTMLIQERSDAAALRSDIEGLQAKRKYLEGFIVIQAERIQLLERVYRAAESIFDTSAKAGIRKTATACPHGNLPSYPSHAWWCDECFQELETALAEVDHLPESPAAASED